MNFKIKSIESNISTAFFKVVLIIFIGFLTNLSNAQVVSQTNSLEKEFNNVNSDTLKFNISLKLIDLFKNIDSAKTSKYLLKTEKLIKTDQQRVLFLSAKASFFIVYGKMKEGNKLLMQALKIAKSKKYLNEEAKIYNNLGVSYLQLSNNSLALKYQLEGLKIREQLNDEIGLESSNINIGNIYFAIFDDDKALFYFRKALVYATKLKLNVELGKIYNNLGAILFDQNNYKLSKSYMLKSLDYKIKTHNRTGEVTSLNSLGDICNAMMNFAEAELYYKKALKLSEELGDDMNKANILNSLGHMERDKGAFSKAISYQRQALDFSKTIDYKDIERDALLELSIDYRNLKQFDKAYQYYKTYTEVKDSIAELSNKSQIAELQTKYETEKKEQRIKLLNKENTIQKLAISRKNIIIILIALFLLTTIILSALFYNRYKLKQESKLQSEIIKQQDMSVKAVLEAEENERKRIANDLHDGVGQMFSTVKLNLSAIENQINFTDEISRVNFFKTISLVDESCKEVRTISHQMAPNVLLKLGLVSAIRDFIQKIDERRLNVNLEVEGINERIENNVETVLYRVVQEVVNNVIKHAEANKLDIQVIRDEEALTVMIEDNGKGFDTSKIDATEGIGLKNIRTRIEFLKGWVDFDSSPGRGTVVSINVPLKKVG